MIFRVLMFLILFKPSLMVAQDCYSQEELKNFLGDSAKTKLDLYEDVTFNTSFFAKFKIDSCGKLYSTWVSDIEYLNTDYNKFISEANESSEWKDKNVESPLALFYRQKKNEQSIKKDILNLLNKKGLKYCNRNYEDIHFVIPVIIDYRKARTYEKHFIHERALETLFKNRVETYFLMSPLVIDKICKQCEY